MKTLNIFSLLVLIIGTSSGLFGQCFNTSKYPFNDVIASNINGTSVQITNNLAGDYCVIKNLVPGQLYTFNSSITGDFITYRVLGGTPSTPANGFGVTPFTFTAVGTMGEFHINLAGCGTSGAGRITSIVSNGWPVAPGKVGIGVPNPNAVLDIAGKIKIADDGLNPTAGNIRWNGTTADFEGYDGTSWHSLTKMQQVGQWGAIPKVTLNEDDELIESSSESDGEYGDKVSINGDYAIVFKGGSARQAVFIFHKNGTDWVEQAKITSQIGLSNVAITADYAFFEGINGVNVYKRTGTTWAFDTTITNLNTYTKSIAISGDYLVVTGRNSDNANIFNFVQVFFHSGNNWTMQFNIVIPNDIFLSVAISGDNFVIGSKFEKVAGNYVPGAVYIYSRTGSSWVQQAKLPDPNGGLNDEFGASVSISGDNIIIGSPGSNNNQGEAYIFSKINNVWIQDAILLPSEQIVSQHFGNSVSMDGLSAIVGNLSGDGRAYIFSKNNTWTEQAKLLNFNHKPSDHFGHDVSISGNTALVGADFVTKGTNIHQGAVYVFYKK
jgi:hypothetical protein